MQHMVATGCTKCYVWPLTHDIALWLNFLEFCASYYFKVPLLVYETCLIIELDIFWTRHLNIDEEMEIISQHKKAL